MYHLTTLLITFFTLFSPPLAVFAQTVTTLSYDPTYDNGSLSLNSVACSDGINGLETKGYTTLDSLPNFPNLGGVYTVTGWNSTQCGSCYAVTYGQVTINMLAVDRSTTGFTVSQEAMNNLTVGQAAALGRVTVTFMQVPSADCGL